MQALPPMPTTVQPPTTAPSLPSRTSTLGARLRSFLFHVTMLGLAAAAYVAHHYFRIDGQPGWALGSLLAAAGLALVPLRALLHQFFAIQGRIMHALHGLGGLAVAGTVLGTGGYTGPLLTHAALAPFAVMGAAQAMMHQDHPRNAQQALALHRFEQSLPEVAQFAKGDLTSPANARRAVAVLSDLLEKARALGETELNADPGFQSALRQASMRFGLSLALDAADQSIGKLAANPAAAAALPDLRRKLAAARQAASADHLH